MAVSVVQTKVTASTTPFVTDGIEALTFDATTTVGNYILVGIAVTQSNRTISSVVDNGSGGSNTYALVSDGSVNANHEIAATAEFWIYGAPVERAATVVTVTISSAIGSPSQMWIAEISGQHASSPIEDVAIALTSPDGTTHTTGNVTTASAGSLLVVMGYGTGGTYTHDADFTSIETSAQGLSGYDQVDAGTFNCVYTSAANEAQVNALVAIAPAAGGGGGATLIFSTTRRMLMGLS